MTGYGDADLETMLNRARSGDGEDLTQLLDSCTSSLSPLARL